MEFIDVNAKNIASEHICCAIADKKGENGVSSKKTWMMERFKDGLVFKKLNVKGKVFIEYIPAEKAWFPIAADNYMHINCLWVSGRFKGQGYANQLLDKCIIDAKEKGKCGLTVLSSVKKVPYLSDPKYLKYKGFLTADTAKPYYELLYLPFQNDAIAPHFKECAKLGRIAEHDMVLYYSNQCPFTEKYAQLIKKIAEQRGINFKLIKFETTEQAQNSPSPSTTYSFFYDGNFVANEIFSDKKFNEFLDEHRL